MTRRAAGVYDYIIAGAGSAGCELSYRLSADPNISVLLLEAGTRGRNLSTGALERFGPLGRRGVSFSVFRNTVRFRTRPEENQMGMNCELLQEGARDLLVNCAGVHAGDRVVVVREERGTGYFDDSVPNLVENEARDLGARVRSLHASLIE